jgi:transcriptional regulator with XRE-family HTH domain
VKPSFLRHPVAILREICGRYQKEFAELIGCSRIYVQKIEQTPEHGGQRLSEKLASRISHETGISIKWLLDADPKAPPISERGEPYTREIFERTQAEKKWFDQPHPGVRRSNAIGFCAQLFAILENANAQEKYYMATYKVDEAIKELQQEFGQDLRVYPVTDPKVVAFGPALEIFRQLMAHGQKVDEEARRAAAVMDAQKKQSSRQNWPEEETGLICQ